MKPLSASVLLGLLVGCGADPGATTPPLSTTVQPLVVSCVEPGVSPAAGSILCGREQLVECGAALPPVVVEATEPGACAAVRLVATPDRLALGGNVVVVRDLARSPVDDVCSATVTVVDRLPPEVTPRVVALWPPNHRMETIRPADCLAVRDACDDAPRAVFTWASVDEPDDATGDGNTSDDVQFAGCDAVAVRAERRGNGDGRVYSLGVRVTDRAGHVVDSVCHVVVAHDQSGRAAVESDPARRMVNPTACR